MRKILMIAVFFCMSALLLSGQEVAFFAGLNYSDANRDVVVDNTRRSVSTDPLPGFRAGMNIDLSKKGPISVNSGIVFSQKGGTVRDDQYVFEYPNTTRITYLEIPLNLKLSYEGNSASFFTEAGPYFGVILSGKTIDADENETNLEFGSEDGQLKSMDYGLNFGVGFELRQIRLTFGYSLGIANISNFDAGAYSGNAESLFKNKGFSISAAILVFN